MSSTPPDTLDRAPDAPETAPAAPDATPHKPSAWSAVILAFLGLLLVVARYVHTTEEILDDYVSLVDLPPDVQTHLDEVLLVPLAAVLVVFCRVSLGLRMLGPFRPILIAVAFVQTGVVLGVCFVALVLTVVVVLRMRLTRRGLPYFARLSVMLASVVLVEIIVLMVGSASDNGALLQTAFFPIIVLCLTADGFARVLGNRGLRQAIWRGSTTLAIAAAISALAAIPAVSRFLIHHPELVLVEMAAIVAIGTHMRWGLLERWNPEETP